MTKIRFKKELSLFLKIFIPILTVVSIGLILIANSRTQTILTSDELYIGTNYFVSKSASSDGNGLSWDQAWNEFDQINWEIIQPGDKIIIDGGEMSMDYRSPLVIEKSGTLERPIRIEMSSEEGKNGQILIDGGSLRDLPYCNQVVYSKEYRSSANVHGIIIENKENIYIDGIFWEGIQISGHRDSGILLKNSRNIYLSNIEVTNNGDAVLAEDGIGNTNWQPRNPGIRFSGENLILDKLHIHDNGQDGLINNEFENTDSIFIRNSWIHNTRISKDEIFNDCNNPSGIALTKQAQITNLNLTDTILGPGLDSGLLSFEAQTEDFEINNILAIFGDHSPTGGFLDLSEGINWNYSNITIANQNSDFKALDLGVATNVTNVVIGERNLGINFDQSCTQNVIFTEFDNGILPINSDLGITNAECSGLGSDIESIAEFIEQIISSNNENLVNRSINEPVIFTQISDEGTNPALQNKITEPIKINFQPLNAEIPAGFVADTGLPYQFQDLDFSYGWNADISVKARQNQANGFNTEQNSFIHMTKGGWNGMHSWEIELPNDIYIIEIGLGDTQKSNSLSNIKVDGVEYIDGTGANEIDTLIIPNLEILDNKLTLEPINIEDNPKLGYVVISRAQN